MFKEKDIVCLLSDPAKKGVVISVSCEGADVQYSVFLDGKIQSFFEEQLRPASAIKTEWVDRQTFQAYLTSSLINTPSARNLYSLNAARIDYVPYQFRPALKILKADEPRILIADSVGVGKTIEAGLIIKELQAHSDLNRIAIICPKPLVAEKKWECEMRERFDEEFVPLDSMALRQALSDTDRDGEWPARLSRVIIPYSIFDDMTFAGNIGKAGKNRKGRIYGLQDVIKLLHFNLVIVDEAHHIRNGSDQKDKAFAYKCTKIFCERADAVVMLTATPIQNSTHDLYTLLNVLRPDLIFDETTFESMGEPNSHVSAISRLARSAANGWRRAALDELGKIEATAWGRAYLVKNPLFEKCRTKLIQTKELTRDERVQLISDIEELHSFNSIINRTRRRDIEDFCVREPRTIEIPFTRYQAKLHDAVLSFERSALAAMHGDRSVAFMMSTIKRQAASCIFGLAPFIKNILERRIAQIDSADQTAEKTVELGKAAVAMLRNMAEEVIALADNLPPEDPKFDAVLNVILEKQTHEKNKIMLFSSFKHTLSYLRGKFREKGIRVGQIDGDVQDEERRELRRRFMLPKSDPEAFDMMLFTEVGSEGLDYQFCDMMVNYDLPWNPMAIEQRIGRIDRRKQTSAKVWIVNVITPGTVDADVYNRCLAKLGVFTESIGDCEEILGELGNDIRTIVLNESLTDDQRQKKLEQMADNAVRLTQAEMKLEEEQKSFFGLDLSNFKDAKAIEEAQSPWLSSGCIRGLVSYYLNKRIAPGTYFLGTGPKKTLRLSREAKEVLLDDLRSSKLPRTAAYLKFQSFLKDIDQTCTATFDREFAQQEPRSVFFTPMHPLVKIAARYFETTRTGAEPCISFRCSRCLLPDVPPGRYPFAVYAWNYKGFTSQFKMVTIPLDEKLQARLPSIVQGAEEFVPSEDASSLWKDIAPIHAQLWRNAKDAWIKETEEQLVYKRQSRLLSLTRKKAVLERKLNLAADPRVLRMLNVQIADETERYETKCAHDNEIARRADIVFRKIANGLIIVEG